MKIVSSKKRLSRCHFIKAMALGVCRLYISDMMAMTTYIIAWFISNSTLLKLLNIRPAVQFLGEV